MVSICIIVNLNDVQAIIVAVVWNTHTYYEKWFMSERKIQQIFKSPF